MTHNFKQTAKSTMLTHQFQPQSTLGPSQFNCHTDKTFLSGTKGSHLNKNSGVRIILFFYLSPYLYAWINLPSDPVITYPHGMRIVHTSQFNIFTHISVPWNCLDWLNCVRDNPEHNLDVLKWQLLSCHSLTTAAHFLVTQSAFCKYHFLPVTHQTDGWLSEHNWNSITVAKLWQCVLHSQNLLAIN